jgi:nicotinamidase-related amidase
MTTANATTPRDPRTDHLLTPQNSALLIVDFQPVQVSSILSMDRHLLVDNAVRVARTAVAYGLPVVVSTINVATGINKPMIPELSSVLPDVAQIDRTMINAWEDDAFRQAVEATGRRKLLIAALWTEVCLVFPALDALAEGYEVFPVVDAIGGTSLEAHVAGLQRVVQAGGQLTTWVQLICELQRDWARSETVPAFRDILFDSSVPFVKQEHELQEALASI